MLAAVIIGPKTIRIESVATPDPGPAEVRVRMEGCGVCGSNLPVWEGRPWFTYPFKPGAPGHEGWGTVDAIGSNVTAIRPGDRVALLSYNAFAEYDVAPETAVVPLPSWINGAPCPGEPLACAINVYRRAAIAAGQSVAIVGIGFLGSLLTSLAARNGARVFAISRRQFALDRAAAAGATATFPLTEDRAAVIEAVKAANGGALCDVVIEATGLAAPLDLAAELTRTRGRLVVAGYHQDGPRQVNMQLWNWRGLDVINAHEREPKQYVTGLREALDAVAAGRLDPAPLITHRFRLEQLNEAFTCMHDRPSNFLKACLTFP